MSEQQKVEATASAVTDPTLRRLREYVAALLAAIIVLGTVVLLVSGLGFITAPEPAFTRVKDLLLFLNPLVGVVIGYYFNKISTEARAESAEATAKQASESAHKADQMRDKAESEVKSTQAEMKETKTCLSDLSKAAEKVLSQPKPGTLGGGEGGAALTETRLELQSALERAKRSMN